MKRLAMGMATKAMERARAEVVARGTMGEGRARVAGRATRRNASASSGDRKGEISSGKARENPLANSMFPWERAVLSSERWVGELKPWQKAYWLAFGLGVAFVVAAKTKRHYEDIEGEEERTKAREGNKRALARALEGRSFIEEGGEGEDPFDGLTPKEIEALVKAQAGERGDVYEGMSPEEINAHEEEYRGKGKLKWPTPTR